MKRRADEQQLSIEKPSPNESTNDSGKLEHAQAQRRGAQGTRGSRHAADSGSNRALQIIVTVPVLLDLLLCHSRAWLPREESRSLPHRPQRNSGFLARARHARGNDRKIRPNGRACHYLVQDSNSRRQDGRDYLVGPGLRKLGNGDTRFRHRGPLKRGGQGVRSISPLSPGKRLRAMR